MSTCTNPECKHREDLPEYGLLNECQYRDIVLRLSDFVPHEFKRIHLREVTMYSSVDSMTEVRIVGVVEY